MSRSPWFLAALVAITAPALLAAAQAPRPGTLTPGGQRVRYVFTDREALLLMPPELVAPPGVRSADWAAWSPDGRYVLARREYVRLESLLTPPEEGMVSLVLWNAKTRRSVEVWKQPLTPYRVEQLRWLHGANVAFAIVEWTPPAVPGNPPPEPRRMLLRVDAAHSSVKPAADLGNQDELVTSPRRPIALLLANEFNMEERPDGTKRVVRSEALRVLAPDGRPGNPVPLPPGVPFYAPSWNRDGTVCFLAYFAPGPAGQRRVQKWLSFDPRSGKLAELEKAPERFEPAPPDLPFTLKNSPATVREAETAQPVHPLWLESASPSERPRALVSADADWAIPAPDGSAILYTTDGAAWVAPIERQPKEVVEAAIREAQRQQAVSNAKQLAVAVLMYAQDYDEMYPPGDGSVNDAIYPYIKNRDAFNNPATGQPGFSFLLGGQALSDIQNPADTILGYLNGPGGRAVMYADGHVKWEQNP